MPKQLFSGNTKKDEINEELLRLYIQKILKLDTSNANVAKFKLHFFELRKTITTRARAISKNIIIQEVSKYSSTKITESKHVIQWYKGEITTQVEKLQCLYTVFTRDIIKTALDEIMEAEKIKYLDKYALPAFATDKIIRGNGFIGDIFTKQIKARRDTVS